MSLPPPLNTPPPEEAGVVIVPNLATEAALIDALCDSPRRLSVVLVALTPEDAAALAARFPRSYVHVSKPGLLPAQLRTRVIVQLDPGHDMPWNMRRFLSRCKRRGIPVFGVSAPQHTAPQLTALSPSAAEALPDQGDWAAIADHLISAMGFERGDGPVLGALARMMQRLIHGRAHILLAPMVRRIASREALSTHLGQPHTIMCLGNGPSSTDPRLAALPHDALFRVNHQWMQDDYMTGADVVFAGVKISMRAAGSTLIGVASGRKEQALLGTRFLTPWRGRLRYVVVEEIADLGESLHGPLRPTTGAVMLAAAIALAPRRLIVAGMDMFSDKAGAYAGGTQAVNAYTSAHDRDTDAAFIRTHLARYDGEIMTLSPAFSELAHSVAGGRFTLASPTQT